ETSALAQRILFEGRRAKAVEYRQQGRVRTVRARKEILVSSGAYNSPQLLQLSGVGPADLLKQHGIDIVLDAPGVGNDLQDHMQVRLITRCAQAITLNDIINPAAETDRAVFIDGIRSFGKILAAPGLRSYAVEEVHPGPKVTSDEDLLEFCRQTGSTVYHPTSTCRRATTRSPSSISAFVY